MISRSRWLLLLCLAVGCNRTTPSPVNPVVAQKPKPEPKAAPERVPVVADEKPGPPRWKPQGAFGFPFHLQPIRWEAREPRPRPIDVIDTLFPGLAADAPARKLLSRLHGDAEVTLLIQKLSDAEVEKVIPEHPPAHGHAVFWAITGWTTEPIDDETEKHAPGRQLHLPVDLDWRYLTCVEREQPQSIPVLLAVANDYLLRHNHGYQLRHGRLPAVLEPMPGDPRPLAEIRAEVDRQIDELERIGKPQQGNPP